LAQLEQILIVGGGIAGLTLATALRRRGWRPELVERETSWGAVGAGIAVQPNGMRVLRSLGLATAVERSGAAIRRWSFRDQDDALLCEIDLNDLWGDVGPFIGIERLGLHRILLGAASALPLRLGTSIAALADGGDRVAVTFNDGSSRAYDLVVGCDGVHSTVRTLALGGAAMAESGQMVWRSIAPVRPRGLTDLRFLLGDGLLFGLCPAGETRTYGFANVATPPFHDPIEGRLTRLRRRFARFGSIVGDYLESLVSDEQIHCSKIDWVAQEHWRAGRVVLIGDAAHASSPMMGQGGCLAMEDAAVLAEELSSSGDVESALDAFVARRSRRVRWVREQSVEAGRSLGLPSAVRNGVLRERGESMLRSRYQPLIERP